MACHLQFNRKSQPCIFSAGLRFVFELKCKQKTRRRILWSVVEREAKETLFSRTVKSAKQFAQLPVFCIRFYSKTKRKPVKKNTGL